LKNGEIFKIIFLPFTSKIPIFYQITGKFKSRVKRNPNAQPFIKDNTGASRYRA
jgi:hypothetical protein